MPVEGIGASNSLSKIAAAQPKYQKQAAPAVSTASVNTNKEQKSKKTPIVVAAVALAAIGSGVYVAKTKGWLGFEKAAKGAKDAATQIKKETEKVAKKTEKVAEQAGRKVADVRKFVEEKTNAEINEAKRVLAENTTKDGFVNLGDIENAAGIKSATVGDKDSFHKAATWLEVSYKDAYSKAEPEEGKNILDKVFNRIANENNSLAKMYAQMPKEEAAVRAEVFGKDLLAVNPEQKGMNLETFVKKLIDEVMPKAAEELKAGKK